MTARRMATTELDFEALICIGAAAAGGTVVIRTQDDEDASIFLNYVVGWADTMKIPAKRDRTWRVLVGDYSGPRSRSGSIESAPHDYAADPGGTELIRDLSPLPKAAPA